MLKKTVLYFVLLLTFLSCQRKPLYLKAEAALKINVQVQADINLLWNVSWRDSLKYNWDESIHGKIGYTLPDYCNVVVLEKGKLVSESKIQSNKRELIDIELGKTYDLLIYSKELFYVDSYYDEGQYYVETPSTTTRYSMNRISEEYDTVIQPGEIFAMNKKEVSISDDLSDFEEVVENGKIIYVYNIDEMLEPVSYIYIVQFIVINDDGSEKIEAKDILNFTISGVSAKKNLFNNEAIYTGNKQIESTDILPCQDLGDSLVFASRITIMDLLPDVPNSSWSSQLDFLYYSSVDVSTYNYGEVTGTKDITEELRKNPKGGVITVRILNSELKKGGQSSGLFGIDIGEWRNHVFNIDC